MPDQTDETTDSLWRVFPKSPPTTITQEAYDFDRKHFRHLTQLRPGDKAESRDLWDYTQDALYTEVQSDLFAYVLPFCLDAWRDDLQRTNSGYGGFVEYFYPVLARAGIFGKHLTTQQTAAVSNFMRAVILDEIDAQRGLSYQGMQSKPYSWFSAFASYGVILPDINRLWSAWWSVDTVGRAIALAQYVSCLIYPENENPIFAPWTPDGGGGPPCLWHFSGHMYTHRWLEPNIDFLRKELSPESVTDGLARAKRKLSGEPELSVIEQLMEDLPLCEEILVTRCRELPEILATKQAPPKSLEWSR